MLPSRGLRILAAFGALGTAGVFLAYQPLVHLRDGCPGTAVAAAATALPLVAFLAFLALDPARLQAILSRWTRIDLGDAGHVGAAVVMAFTLFFLLGWGGLVSGVLTVEPLLVASCPAFEGGAPTSDGLAAAAVLTFAFFVLPTLLYVAVVHGLGPANAFRALGLREEGALRFIVLGAGLALGFLVLLALVVAAASPFLPEAVLRNDQALEIVRSVTPASALLLAVGSGLGEEVFFRGFLQPRLGLWATSVVFALAHVNYGSVSEVVVVFVLSLALGYAYRRTGNLWTPVAAHFTFNFVQLLVGMYAPVPPP